MGEVRRRQKPLVSIASYFDSRHFFGVSGGWAISHRGVSPSSRVRGRPRMFFGTPMRLNHSSLSESIASLIQMPWHGSQLSRASLPSKSSGGVDEARRQETRMGKTRSFNEPCGGGNKIRSRRRLRLQGVGRGGVAMQGVEHREQPAPAPRSGRYAEAA